MPGGQSCEGRKVGHCCIYKGVVCPHLVEKEADDPDQGNQKRRWHCDLYESLGNWNAVLNSDDYIEQVQPLWDSLDPPENGYNCKDWPQKYPEVMDALCGQCCYDENLPVDQDYT